MVIWKGVCLAEKPHEIFNSLMYFDMFIHCCWFPYWQIMCNGSFWLLHTFHNQGFHKQPKTLIQRIRPCHCRLAERLMGSTSVADLIWSQPKKRNSRWFHQLHGWKIPELSEMEVDLAKSHRFLVSPWLPCNRHDKRYIRRVNLIPNPINHEKKHH